LDTSALAPVIPPALAARLDAAAEDMMETTIHFALVRI
jgi:hypothetical protein